MNKLHASSELIAHYTRAGLVTLICDGKRPVAPNWQHTTLEDARNLHWNPSQNIGILCGPNSNNLVVIDCDGWTGYHALIEKFPHFASTFTTATGGGGAHIYLFVDELPHNHDVKKIASLDNGNIEVKSTGRQVIAPPSIHPDTGKPYTALVSRPIMRLPNLDDVIGWLDTLKPRPPVPKVVRRGQSAIQRRPANTAERAERAYVAKALEESLTCVRSAASGERNETLFRQARRLFDIAAESKFLSHPEVEQACLSAAPIGPDFPQREAATTIASAALDKYRKPANLPDFSVIETVGNTALQPMPDPAVQAALWKDGLPDSWRSALLTYFNSSSASVVEVVLQGINRGHLPEACFSSADIQEAARQLGQEISAPAISRALKKDDPNSLLDVFFSEFPPINVESRVGNLEKKYLGRTPRLYRLLDKPIIWREFSIRCKRRIYERCNPVSGDSPVVAHVTPDMVEQAGMEEPEPTAAAINRAMSPVHKLQDNAQQRALWRARQTYERLLRDLAVEHSTPLPSGWPWGNGSDYRKAFAHGLVRAKPGARVSKREWSERLGLEPRSVKSVTQNAQLGSIKQSDTVALNKQKPVEAQVRTNGKRVRGFPLSVISLNEAGEVIAEVSYSPEVAALALKTAASVSIKYQVANRYEVVCETPPEKVERATRREPGESRQVESETEQTTEYTKGLPKPGHYHGADYDPAWRFCQWVMMLERTTDYRVIRGRVVDVFTGEIIRQEPSEVDLIKLILGREL